MTMTAADIIATLDLTPHPEGGHYRQTWARPGPDRALATAIHFLLAGDERSHWHTVDADEVWLFHSGAPLILSIAADDTGPATDHSLGPDLAVSRPQIVVPAHHWQAARSTGDWSLVSCIVSPGFEFDGFVLAAPGFDIPRR